MMKTLAIFIALVVLVGPALGGPPPFLPGDFEYFQGSLTDYTTSMIYDGWYSTDGGTTWSVVNTTHVYYDNSGDGLPDTSDNATPGDTTDDYTVLMGKTVAPGAVSPGGGATETQWGILQIEELSRGVVAGPNQITPDTITPVGYFDWINKNYNHQLVGILHGQGDASVQFTSVTTEPFDLNKDGVNDTVIVTDYTHDVYAKDIDIDVYWQPGPSTATYPYNPYLGVGGRHGVADKYDTVGYYWDGLAFQPIPTAIHALKLESTSGFFPDAPALGGPETWVHYTYHGDFDLTDSDTDGTKDTIVAAWHPDTGTHEMFLNVTDGDWEEWFDWDVFPLGGATSTGVADVRAKVASDQQTGVGDWFIESDDDFEGAMPVPGAGVLGLVGLGTLGLVRTLRRRRLRRE